MLLIQILDPKSRPRNPSFSPTPPLRRRPSPNADATLTTVIQPTPMTSRWIQLAPQYRPFENTVAG
jgi:hypothetical protein